MGSIVSNSEEQPLGILPQQIRGSLSQSSQLTLLGHSSDSCTACSRAVSYFPLLNGKSFICAPANGQNFNYSPVQLNKFIFVGKREH
jgi:ubiquitin-like modifier-activating enzyme ATG7